MSLPKAFQPFVEGAPSAVISRLALEYLVDDVALGMLFADHATAQYERDVTLTNLVNVMLDVACGGRRSPRAAFQSRSDEIAASLSAFYGKLKRTELGISEAIVAHSGKKAGQLIRAMKGLDTEPVLGFPSYVLDGNMLTGTEHRLKPLRNTRAAALPGKSLVVYEYATGVVTEAVLWEDAHSQERAILPKVKITKGMHVIADRNFCVLQFFRRIQQARAFFTIRHHRSTFPLKSASLGKVRQCGRCETGVVSEQTVTTKDVDGQVFSWRKLTLKLDEPTRDGEKTIVLISNLPRRVKATTIATAYRERWTIEQHFQRLTDWLHCEVSSLGYPRAALFAFAMSLVAANAFAILIAAFRAVHGREAADNLSYATLVDEVAGTYRGMMLALPATHWSFVHRSTTVQTARLLRSIVRHANLKVLTKTRRGPKKPRRTPNCKNIKHLSTYRLLNQPLEKAC
jgi:IS4 transposase